MCGLLFVPHPAELLPARPFAGDFHGYLGEPLSRHRAEFPRAFGLWLRFEIEVGTAESERPAVDRVDAWSGMAGEANQGFIGLPLGEPFEFVTFMKKRRKQEVPSIHEMEPAFAEQQTATQFPFKKRLRRLKLLIRLSLLGIKFSQCPIDSHLHAFNQRRDDQISLSVHENRTTHERPHRAGRKLWGFGI